MAAGLPELLDALGEVFLVPGACPAPALAAAGREPWVPEALDAALERMVQADRRDLDVAYTGLFLVGAALPLEASVLRAGQLLDEGVLDELEGAYGAAGLQPGPGLHPDHLGLLLPLLGHLLRRLDAGPEAEPAARDLLVRHLGPLAAAVGAALARDGVPAFYGAAGLALGEACALAGKLLA